MASRSQTLAVGGADNDATGDTLRLAAKKIAGYGGTNTAMPGLGWANIQSFALDGQDISNGTTDATQALIAAIDSLPLVGGTVFFPPGLYRVTGAGTIATFLNSKRQIVLLGSNGNTWRGTVPGIAAQTIIYCNEMTDYFFKKSGTVNESLQYRDIAFDGSNGLGTAFGSLTCPGIVASNGFQTNYFSAYNVICTDFRYAHNSLTGPTGRAIFDFDIGVHSRFDHCFLGVVENGRMFYTGDGSTTFKANDCYISGCREAYYHRATYSISYTDCIFESCVVVGAQYLSNVQHNGCHYENVGADLGGTHATTGLAPRNHGIGGGIGTLLAGNVNTAFNQLYGDFAVDGGNFAYITGTAPPYSAWMECLGVAGGSGVGGSLSVRNSRKNDGALTDTLFSTTMAFGTAERDQYFTIHLEDSFGVSPAGAIIIKATDARKVNTGKCRVANNDGTTMNATIHGGRFWYDCQDTATAYTAAPTSYPRNDQNQVGDKLYYPTPAASGFEGQICTTAGTPGTWKTFGPISA